MLNKLFKLTDILGNLHRLHDSADIFQTIYIFTHLPGERLHDFDVLLTSDTTNPGLSTHTKRCKHRAGVVASKATDTVKCDTPTVGK